MKIQHNVKYFGRVSICILILSVCCGALPFVFPQWCNLLAFQGSYGDYGGDVNGDGDIDLTDAILTLQITSCIYLPHQTYVTIYADVNDDHKIGTEEAIYILQKAAGLR